MFFKDFSGNDRSACGPEIKLILSKFNMTFFGGQIECRLFFILVPEDKDVLKLKSLGPVDGIHFDIIPFLGFGYLHMKPYIEHS